MRPIKLFSEFLHPPRPILNLPFIGQIQTSQIVVTLGVALSGGMLAKAIGGIGLWVFATMFLGLGTLTLTKQEHDHTPAGERLLGLLRCLALRHLNPEALTFRPQDGAPLTADSLQAFITLGGDRRGRLLRRRGGRG